MFAPFTGPVLKVGYLETFFSCAAGAILSSAVFYFSAGYLMKRANEKRLAKLEGDIPPEERIKMTRKFTRMNKFVVRIKRSLGMIGITFWAPFFLSIPLGSIIVAKFYGNKKIAYPMIVLGIFVNGIITTSIAYIFL